MAARAALKTTIFGDPDPTPPPRPPADLFVTTHYPSAGAELVAYETPPAPGARKPAVIWIAGGFQWGIDQSSWTPADRSNDQSAAALRPAGVVLMVPALRGQSGNPGKPECFLGEVDDILAARDHVAQRADVDPTRIYLVGHSTGGTLVLLATASTDKFRAVFSLGPVADPRQYGGGCMPANVTEAEAAVRAPKAWIQDVVSPTFVIYGAEESNLRTRPMLERAASRAVSFATIAGADHFTAVRPVSEAIASAVLADTGSTPAIRLDANAIAATVAH